jgi:putative PIN family toxin of toxin-antitoxin system
MRVVLDTNVLISAIGRNSPLKPIWSSFLFGKYELLLSDEVVNEYEEILQARCAPGASNLVMKILIEARNVIHKHVYYSWNAIKKDPDDNKFFDLAIAGHADYLVTNDRHFNVLKKLAFPQVKVINAIEFMAILSAAESQ